jgi:DNA-binding transcriptional MerR regulator
MAEEGFRGPQVCKIVGITYRQLDYWARTNLIRPSIADAKGSGTQRRYSYRDLVELKVIKNLLDAGVSLQLARKGIEYIRQNLGEDIASANLVMNGPHPVLAKSLISCAKARACSASSPSAPLSTISTSPSTNCARRRSPIRRPHPLRR